LRGEKCLDEQFLSGVWHEIVIYVVSRKIVEILNQRDIHLSGCFLSW
jgi:hypothetical protein